MTTRHVNTEFERQQCVKFMQNKPLPLTVTMAEGRHRSAEQNALQWKWCQEVASQKGDQTATEIQAYNKLHFGVPILREENEAFRLVYDEFIRPHTYESKLKLMEGDTFGVTRLMNTKQKTRYLDAICKHWLEQGMVLSIPEQG